MSRCRRCAPVPEEVRRAADLLERRWVVSVLYALASGATRFNEFKQALGEVPPRTLAQRLTELEQAGVLERVLVDARPPRAEYRLTPRGEQLRLVVDALARWGSALASSRSRAGSSPLAGVARNRRRRAASG
jgi:DNA-binding HxlR family transcriptional regulator